VSLEQLVKLGLVSDLEVSRLDGLVIDTQDDVDVVHRLGLDVGELLDLVGGVLDLVVRHLELELLDSRLDGVPAGQTVAVGREDAHSSVRSEQSANTAAGRGKREAWQGRRKKEAYPIETYRVIPKSSGLRISYVDGLLRIAFAWIPALWVKAHQPVM
jgi:hypothetical protein